MMKKKVLNICLVLIFACGLLAGCKKDAGTPEDNAIVEDAEDTKDTEKTSYKIGYVCIDMVNPYFDALQLSIETALEENGCILISKDPAMNSDTQIAQINELIEEEVDAVLLCPVDWEAVTPALVALKEAGIPIINLDTQVKEMDYVDAYVGSDNKNAGFLCGEDLIKKRPDGGKIVIMESPSMNSINERITGFEEAITASGFEVVERVDTKGDLNTALSEMKRILATYDEIDAVMCGNDPTAIGALVAVNNVKREGVLIYGVDGSPDLKKELVKPGTSVAGTAAQSPINVGRRAVETDRKSVV